MIETNSQHITFTFENVEFIGLVHWTDATTTDRTRQMLEEKES